MRQIAEGLREGEGLLAGRNGAGQSRPTVLKYSVMIEGDPAQPTGSSRASARVSASRRQSKIALKSPRRKERIAQGEPEINGLLERVSTLGKMPQGHSAPAQNTRPPRGSAERSRAR